MGLLILVFNLMELVRIIEVSKLGFIVNNSGEFLQFLEKNREKDKKLENNILVEELFDARLSVKNLLQALKMFNKD